MRKWLSIALTLIIVLSVSVSSFAETCPSCKQELPDDSSVCSQCGTSLSEADAQTRNDGTAQLSFVETKDGKTTYSVSDTGESFSVEAVKVNDDTYYGVTFLNNAIEHVMLGNYSGYSTMQFSDTIENCYGFGINFAAKASEPELFREATWYLSVLDQQDNFLASAVVSDLPEFKVLDLSSGFNTDDMMHTTVFTGEPLNGVSQIVLVPDLGGAEIDSGFYFSFNFNVELFFKSKEALYDYLSSNFNLSYASAQQIEFPGEEKEKEAREPIDAPVYFLKAEDGSMVFFAPTLNRTIPVEVCNTDEGPFYGIRVKDVSAGYPVQGSLEGISTIHLADGIESCYGVCFEYELSVDDPKKYSDVDWYLFLADSNGKLLGGDCISDDENFILHSVSSSDDSELIELCILTSEPFDDLSHVFILGDTGSPFQTVFSFDPETVIVYFRSEDDMGKYIHQYLEENMV